MKHGTGCSVSGGDDKATKAPYTNDLASTCPGCHGSMETLDGSGMTCPVPHCRCWSLRAVGGCWRRCLRHTCARPCAATSRWPALTAPTAPRSMPCTRMWHPIVQSPRSCSAEASWGSTWSGCGLVPQSGCWCHRRSCRRGSRAPSPYSKPHIDRTMPIDSSCRGTVDP